MREVPHGMLTLLPVQSQQDTGGLGMGRTAARGANIGLRGWQRPEASWDIMLGGLDMLMTRAMPAGGMRGLYTRACTVQGQWAPWYLVRKRLLCKFMATMLAGAAC